MNQKGLIVGMTRFELATPRPPDVCATGLRYIPNNWTANVNANSAKSKNIRMKLITTMSLIGCL